MELISLSQISSNFLPSFEAISLAVQSISTKLNWSQVDIYVGGKLFSKLFPTHFFICIEIAFVPLEIKLKS